MKNDQSEIWAKEPTLRAKEPEFRPLYQNASTEVLALEPEVWFLSRVWCPARMSQYAIS